jgi:hypothetical protein
MKKIVLILVLLIAGTSAVISYYWYQATKLPDWYDSQKETTQPSATNNTEDITQEGATTSPLLIDKADARTQKSNGKSVEINLSEADINKLIISEIAKKTGNRQLPEAVKGVNTTIQNGKIETGAVVNFSKIQTAQIGESEKMAIDKLTKTFPFLENREVYIGVAGKPDVGEDGKLKFDENTQIKVGKLSFPLSEISNQLGIPKEQIEKRINLELQLGRVKVENIEFSDKKALIKGSSN